MTNKPISFYAVRIKGTDYFKNSKHLSFSSFEDAIANGVFYNQRKSAEKVVKDSIKRLTGTHGYPPVYSRFNLYDPETDRPRYCSSIQSFVDTESERYEIEFMEIELEIVELHMTQAEVVL
jgi:hypothetical protein